MTVKEQVHKIIDDLPDDMNLNDIAYTLYVISKIEQGEKEIKEGKGIPHNEAIKIINSW
jgi:predicted transcriptional regulator